VLLGRLRVRGKLAVLVATPLVMVVILAAFVSVDRFNRAADAASTVKSVEVATEVGAVIADLQQERLASVGYLLGSATQADVSLATATVGDEVADVTAELGDELRPDVQAALRAVSKLDPLRDALLAHRAAPDDVIAQFSAVITSLLSSLRLADGVDGTTVTGREVIALDALQRVDELNNQAAAELVVAAGTKSPNSVIAYAGDRAAVAAILSQFTTYATTEQTALYGLVGKAFTDRIGPTFDQSFAVAPTATIAQLPASVIYPELTSFVVLGRFVETKIAADVTSAVTSRKNDDLIAAYGTAGLALLLVLLIGLLSIAVARAVATPLTQLTHSADRVARIAEAELERVADDESNTLEPIRLETVSVSAQDEVGELSRAFERVQSTAARLVERQAQSRRNVAEMLGHIGRRTQNLVGRQISIIDGLESDETDSSRLSELYRLDHIASRLRRNAGSLVVLSGASDAGGHFAPLPVVDVARLALAEIESYTRVDISIPDDVFVPPAIVNDLVLVLAELMENATVFSPPHTRVTVTAADGVVRIVDHGIGLSEERIAEENRRIAQRERLDLTPSEVLGLFVVGRLARRHGFSVVLSPTPNGGVTVHVDLSEHVVLAPTERLDAIAAAAPSLPDRAATPALPSRAPAAGGPTLPSMPLPRRNPDVSSVPTAGYAPSPPVWDFTPATNGHAATGPDDLPSAGRWTAPAIPAARVPEVPSPVRPTSAVAGAADDPAVNAAMEAAAQVAAIQAATEAAQRVARRSVEDAELVDDDDRESVARPARPDPPYNAKSLDRAMLMLEAARPWNAFELPQPALPAPPPPLAPGESIERLSPPVEPSSAPFAFQPMARPATGRAPVPAAGASTAAQAAGTPPAGLLAGTGTQPVVVGGGTPLVRRVPGATTVDEPLQTASTRSRPQLDASEARDLIEAFEFGVARALREVEDEPVQVHGWGKTEEA
jgi:signal transduction histidine kinase